MDTEQEPGWEPEQEPALAAAAEQLYIQVTMELEQSAGEHASC